MWRRGAGCCRLQRSERGLEIRMGKESERRAYPTDLTDEQWKNIEPLFSGLRTCKWSKRELTNAVLHLVDSGCKWRQLPHDFPPYSTVHSFYRRARIQGLWQNILAHLVRQTRKNAGRAEEPSYAIGYLAKSPYSSGGKFFGRFFPVRFAELAG